MARLNLRMPFSKNPGNRRMLLPITTGACPSGKNEYRWPSLPKSELIQRY